MVSPFTTALRLLPDTSIPRAALLAALLALAGAAHAQQAASVSGTVQNGTGHGLPFATAVLLHLPDSAVTASQTTTAQGAFRFEYIAAGRYCLRALGYTAGRVPVVVGDQPVRVPALQLAATATALKEVVVQGRPRCWSSTPTAPWSTWTASIQPATMPSKH